MRKTVILLVLVIAVAAFSAFAHFGGFHPVTVHEKSVGPFTLIFEQNKGPYYQAGKSVEKLLKIAKAHDVRSKIGFGKYYDDPEKVIEAELRSDAGLIVSQTELLKLEPYLEGFQRAEFPETRALVAEFPLKGFLSIILGTWKVYPKMTAALEAQGFPETFTFEIYEIEKQRTTYAFPVQK